MRKVYNWIANNIDIIAILALLFLAFLGITSCSRKTVGVIQKTEVRYIDSTIYHIDTTYVQLPNEKVTDVVYMWDTLYLETSVANATAYIDSKTKTLKGTLNNKDSVKTVIEYQDRYVYKDSLVYVKEPYEVKVVEYKAPKWMKWYLALTLLGALIIILIKTRTKWLQILLKILH